jgi:hypothetical protein
MEVAHLPRGKEKLLSEIKSYFAVYQIIPNPYTVGLGMLKICM